MFEVSAAATSMLRALVTSHLVANRRFQLQQLEHFFDCRPRTLSAGRRRAYETKFEALFNRPYQAVFYAALI